ncbi:hypothetical protein QTO34_010078 [Cnephaeus nilssonii]|uniref:Peptidase S1 domain-containing protein n=1 Tax=Cnephaeus nilssonii TaxID=3371016 RepID=A0AA40LEK5_CNENI|nr:hypothetical protein QTO34_010078 [Eptesicus nilssonii]
MGACVALGGDAGSPLICQGTLQGLVSSDYFPCRPPFHPIIYIHFLSFSFVPTPKATQAPMGSHHDLGRELRRESQESRTGKV